MASENRVRQFREILIWPLQLVPLHESDAARNHWDLLSESGPDHPWREIADEFTADPDQFCARHYLEFTRFAVRGNDELYAEVRAEVHDINNYLDSRRTKKLADIGVRLGVVATFGFIGVFITGFFGMNLFPFGEGPLGMRILNLILALVIATALTAYTISISRRLADFLDALSSERVPWRGKLAAFAAVWKKRR